VHDAASKLMSALDTAQKAKAQSIFPDSPTDEE
jgi:hypothetical protein